MMSGSHAYTQNKIQIKLQSFSFVMTSKSREDEMASAIAALEQLKSWAVEGQPSEKALLPICGGVAFAEGSVVLDSKPVTLRIGGDYFVKCSPSHAISVLERRAGNKHTSHEQAGIPEASAVIATKEQPKRSKASKPKASAAAAVAAAAVVPDVRSTGIAVDDSDGDDLDWDGGGLFEIEEFVDGSGKEVSSRVIDMRSKIEATEKLRLNLLKSSEKSPGDGFERRSGGAKETPRSSSPSTTTTSSSSSTPAAASAASATSTAAAAAAAVPVVPLETTLSALDLLMAQEEMEEGQQRENAASATSLQSTAWARGFFGGSGGKGGAGRHKSKTSPRHNSDHHRSENARAPSSSSSSSTSPSPLPAPLTTASATTEESPTQQQQDKQPQQQQQQQQQQQLKPGLVMVVRPSREPSSCDQAPLHDPSPSGGAIGPIGRGNSQTAEPNPFLGFRGQVKDRVNRAAAQNSSALPKDQATDGQITRETAAAAGQPKPMSKFKASRLGLLQDN
jgi:prefoldin subunit 5